MDPLLTVEETSLIHARMRDGVELACTLHKPRRAGPWPGVLVRTPYGREGFKQAEFFAARGYVVAVADARGTGDSEGVYTYYNIHDGLHDGYDLVEWLAGLECCDGNVGTTGGSALGIYQLLTAGTQPPHLRCMCPSAYPLDFYTDQWYPGGVFRPGNRWSWAAGLAWRSGHETVKPNAEGLDDSQRDRLRKLSAERFARREAELRADRLPGMQWAQPYLDAAVRTDVWDAIDLTPHIRGTKVPALHSAVQFDHFGIGTLRGWMLHGGPKRLVMVPGSLGFEGEQGEFGDNLELLWFEKHLKGRDVDALHPPVLAYIGGGGGWLEFEEWPATQQRTLHLAPKGELLGAPSAKPTIAELRHDPAAPALSRDEKDYAPFAEQRNVLSFASTPMRRATTVFGQPSLRLRLRTSMPDANLIARFCVVAKDGKVRALNFGPRKLSLREDLSRPVAVPAGKSFEVNLEFWTVCYLLSVGDRVQITLSASDYPFFENSPHAGSIRIDSGTLTIPVLP